MGLTALYAPKSAAKIAEAAHLIRKAAHLLDNAGDNAVIAAIEAIDGVDQINVALAAELDALANRLDQ